MTNLPNWLRDLLLDHRPAREVPHTPGHDRAVERLDERLSAVEERVAMFEAELRMHRRILSAEEASEQ